MIITTEEYIHYLLKRSFPAANKELEETKEQEGLLISNKWLGLIPLSLKILYQRKNTS